MKMKYLVLSIVFLLMMIMGVEGAQSASTLPVVRIGIVRDGPTIRFQEEVDLIKKEILALVIDEFDVRFLPDKVLEGDWTASGVKRAIDTVLTDPEVDLIITLGILASNDVCQRRHLKKPVIAPFILDAKAQMLPLKDGASGVKNLVYINDLRTLERDVLVFREIVSFKHLTVLSDRIIIDAFPGARKLVRQIGYEFTIDVDLVAVDTSAENALAALPQETDAVLITPLLRMMPDEFQKLVSGLIDRRLPSFSMMGLEEVEQGILASTAPKSDHVRLARRIALNVQRILLGEDAGTFKVAFATSDKLTINMATARAINVYPTWRVMTEAELINEEITEIERRVTLESVVKEALAANLDLLAARQGVAAGDQTVREARSVLYPQLGLESQGVLIDEDRAQGSMGAQPERTWTGSATASQIIYSEDAWSAYTSQTYLQYSREQELVTLRLDIIRDAAIAYLNVLRANTLVNIQKSSLKLTRANLERARVRQSIGVAGPVEVYRWQSEIANNRKNVLTAQAQRSQAMEDLNRILHYPLGEPFIAEKATLTNPRLFISHGNFSKYVKNMRDFRIFFDFMVNEGLQISPELRRFDAVIASQKRTLLAAQRAFWLPTFGLQGNLNKEFYTGGEGADGSSLSKSNDTNWSVGLNATFSLYSGGKKSASAQRVREELAQLQTQRRAAHDQIQQRIRFALHNTSASFPGIQLSKDAATAAHKNFNLVTDSYERGAVSIIDLLDAQNAYLNADRASLNAVYDFLIDQMEVQRAVGRFEMLTSEKERVAVFQRIEDFFLKAGVRP